MRIGLCRRNRNAGISVFAKEKKDIAPVGK
jgi:hypothetical protein